MADSPATGQLPSCPLCGRCSILFDTNPSVACIECGCEVWGETPRDAIAKCRKRRVVKPGPFRIVRRGDDMPIDRLTGISND